MDATHPPRTPGLKKPEVWRSIGGAMSWSPASTLQLMAFLLRMAEFLLHSHQSALLRTHCHYCFAIFCDALELDINTLPSPRGECFSYIGRVSYLGQPCSSSQATQSLPGLPCCIAHRGSLSTICLQAFNTFIRKLLIT
ncbi:hypothetical protein E2C01_015297 [Portunus trituberculatus]|uniref:Uncharacterized protein n=1 Tax=Portunus trituberculatus TaxID=210409 RepID=A0A5B7DMT1_PORTR|nr:hypothetical protein [Portunus trituberculatus]